MGQRGFPRSNPDILNIRGTYRADRHAGAEPAAMKLAKVPPAPKHLGEIARKFWKKMGKYLVSVDLLTEADLPAFEGYCIAYERAREAEEIVATEGRTISTALGGRRRHPELLTAEKARADMRKYETDFGLTPAARARMVAPGKSAKAPKANAFGAVAAAAKRGA
jgi:P27 family predicted phage terminase small subunit